jgi:hypothetical protein
MSATAEVLSRAPLMRLEQEIAEVIPARAIRPVPTQPMPDYVAHQEGVSRVGALSAEAVARDFEATAKEIEAMGAELVDAARNCEVMTADVHKAIEFVRDTAMAYREEAKRIFKRIEDCAIISQNVRTTCTALREKIAGVDVDDVGRRDVLAPT